MRIELEPIGYVRSSRSDMDDDFWGSVEAGIELSDAYDTEALAGRFGLAAYDLNGVNPEGLVRQAEEALNHRRN